MIIEETADNIAEAARSVTRGLLTAFVPTTPVVIKPNVVNSSSPPVTTDVRVAEGVIRALEEYGVRDIVIAEGSGSGDTVANLRRLGYSHLGIPLIDLDRDKTVTLMVPRYRVWKDLTVPRILLEKFIISVPVLKEHSLCGVSLSLKNMVGILPARRYSGYWEYKKSEIHRHDPDGCIADILRTISPDWAVVDATVGMRGSHLCGTPITPPIRTVYASADPVEADIHGCGLLGIAWRAIPYLCLIADEKHISPTQ